MVIDDDDIGRHGFLARQIDMARFEIGTRRTQAIVSGACHQWNDGRTVVEPRQLREITGSG